jgi:UDP-glucose 4-epimerase
MADREQDLARFTAGTDAVVHLAALDAAACASDPQAAVDLNVAATERLLQAAQACGTRRFVYLSTIHVYRAPLSGVIDESSIADPEHIYAVTHRDAENLVLAASGKMETVVVRLSNAVGPPSHEPCNCWHLVANDLCRQAVTDRALLLKSAGFQHRDFVPMTDVVNALDHLLDAPLVEPGGSVFNLGGNRSMSVRALAGLVADRSEALLGYAPEIRVPDGEAGEPGTPFTFSNEKIEEAGFTERAELGDEIDACLRYCSGNFSGSKG